MEGNARLMWMLQNRYYKVFFDHNHKSEAEKLRATHPALRYARLTEVLQMWPDKIDEGVLYDRYTYKGETYKRYY